MYNTHGNFLTMTFLKEVTCARYVQMSHDLTLFKSCKAALKFLINVLLTTMAALGRPKNLLSYARRGGSIPQEGLGAPWFNDGNIFLFTNDRAFKIYMGHLREHAPQFNERLDNFSDDSVDFIQNHPAIAVDDSSDDLAYFLSAIFEGYGRYSHVA